MYSFGPNSQKMAARSYSKTDGTYPLQQMYGVNCERNGSLTSLGWTYQAAKDWFPAWFQWCETKGWQQNEIMSLTEFETAWNDAVASSMYYMGGGIYIPPDGVSQSRAHIIAPDGWYYVRYGCMTALGRYTGRHAQVYAETSGNNKGYSPGTAIEIDHAGWLSARSPLRACINATAWGKDYSVIGGKAYTEGIIVEYFRLVGGMSGKPKDPSFTGVGITMNDPGENSVVRFCMSCDHNNSGYAIFNGTPLKIDTCSAFTNKDEGFLLYGSNGLCNLTIIIPSGDDNPALIRLKPRDGQSVGGATVNIIGMKSESRTILQRPIVVEGNLGDLNMTITGMTANFDGPACPELIYIEKGNQWSVDARGVDLRSNTQSLLYHAASGKRLTGGKPYSGNSFGVNDEGLYLKSRANMTWVSSAPPPNAPIIDSFTATPSSLTGAGTVTLTWQTTNATSVTISGVSGTLPVDGNTTVQVSTTTTYTLTATGSGGTTSTAVTIAVSATPPSGNLSRTGWTAKASSSDGTNTPEKAINGNVNDFWMASGSMTTSSPTFTVDTKKSQVMKGTTFAAPPGYAGSWPRTFEVLTSNSNSDNPTDASFVSRGKFNGAFNSQATFTATGRHMRIICRTANSDWMGISDLNIQG